MDEAYWLTCLRYVEQNPVGAHLVRAPEDYRWTSYRVHAMGTSNNWLVPHRVYPQLGPTPIERQQVYRALSMVSDTVDTLIHPV